MEHKLSLAIVKEDGLLLRSVSIKNEEICLEAVKQNGLALQYVDDQTVEICKEALRQNVNSIKFVNIPLPFYTNQHETSTRTVIVVDIDGEFMFSCGCQNNINKAEFLRQIYVDDGLTKNPHRQEYIEILKLY